MDTGKYDRTVSLLCSTCGNTQFESEKGTDETIEMAKCASCGRVFTKEELIQENSENISEHIKEIGNQVTKDLAKEMKGSLQKAFKGSKNIRIK